MVEGSEVGIGVVEHEEGWCWVRLGGWEVGIGIRIEMGLRLVLRLGWDRDLEGGWGKGIEGRKLKGF